MKIKDIPVEDLIFIDESGVNLAMLRIYARALKGRRARGNKPQKRGKNVSLLTALSLNQVVESSNIYGAVLCTGQKFREKLAKQYGKRV